MAARMEAVTIPVALSFARQLLQTIQQNIAERLNEAHDRNRLFTKFDKAADDAQNEIFIILCTFPITPQSVFDLCIKIPNLKGNIKNAQDTLALACSLLDEILLAISLTDPEPVAAVGEFVKQLRTLTSRLRTVHLSPAYAIME